MYLALIRSSPSCGTDTGTSTILNVSDEGIPFGLSRRIMALHEVIILIGLDENGFPKLILNP